MLRDTGQGHSTAPKPHNSVEFKTDTEHSISLLLTYGKAAAALHVSHMMLNSRLKGSRS